MSEYNDYYVYVYYFKDTNVIFYVGKGRKNRYKSMCHRSDEFMNIINSNNYDCKFIKENMTEEQAFVIEKETISNLLNEENYGILVSGYDNTGKEYILVNKSYGGEGPSGYKLSDETRQKMSESRFGENNNFFGKTHSEETKEKIRQKRLGTKASEETKKKLSEMRKGSGNSMYGKTGEKSPLYGKKHSEETKNKQSESLGTSIYCKELDLKFTSLTKAEKYGKEQLKIPKFNRKALQKACNSGNPYGYIIENNIEKELHWEYIVKPTTTERTDGAE